MSTKPGATTNPEASKVFRTRAVNILSHLTDHAILNGHIGYLIEVLGRIYYAAILDNEFAHYAKTLSRTAMRTAMPFSTWFKMAERCESATSEEISRPRLIGPWMHHNHILFGGFHVLQSQTVEAEIFGSREGCFALTFELNAQHHDDVGVSNRLFHIGCQFDTRRDLPDLQRQQRRRAA